MSADAADTRDALIKRRVRKGALGLAALAAAFYFGFILLLVLRSHH